MKTVDRENPASVTNKISVSDWLLRVVPAPKHKIVRYLFELKPGLVRVSFSSTPAMSSFLPSPVPFISKALAANITSDAAKLYLDANTNFAALNWFEGWWAAWYLWIQDPTMATGLMSFLMHEVGRSLFAAEIC